MANLHIWQQNINRSLNDQSNLLASLKTEYDICLIQEPYINFKRKMQANAHWSIIYLETHPANPKATCSLILINTQLKYNSWTHIPFKLPDITAVQLVGNFGTLC
jgi:hypothetical protein